MNNSRKNTGNPGKTITHLECRKLLESAERLAEIHKQDAINLANQVNQMAKERDEAIAALSGRTVSCVCGAEPRLAESQRETQAMEARYVETLSRAEAAEKRLEEMDEDALEAVTVLAERDKFSKELAEKSAEVEGLRQENERLSRMEDRVAAVEASVKTASDFIVGSHYGKKLNGEIIQLSGALAVALDELRRLNENPAKYCGGNCTACDDAYKEVDALRRQLSECWEREAALLEIIARKNGGLREALNFIRPRADEGWAWLEQVLEIAPEPRSTEGPKP